jgi:hypothetical protein
MVSVLCIYVYENRTMKPTKIVLKSGEGEGGEQWRRKSKIRCKHICKYHNETP